MKSVETVRIELQYSRVGIALVAAVAVSTVTVLIATPMRVGLAAASIFAVAVLALEALLRVVLLRPPHGVQRLRMQRGGAIEVECASGERAEGRVRPGSFVAPWLVVVRWRRSGAWRDSTVLVLPDMAPAEDLRRLRVLLRWTQQGEP